MGTFRKKRQKVDLEQHWELPDCSLTKVSEVMSRDVPKVNLDDSVLDACETILGKHSTGAVVFQGNRAVSDHSIFNRVVRLIPDGAALW